MQREKVIHPLAPIYDKNSEVLILGSFPSIVSRKLNFYYANQNNRFWKVLERVFEEDILDRNEFCKRNHIALWDVIQSCTIYGSSDASITDVKVNPIDTLLTKSNIHMIFTTGKKADLLYKKYIHLDMNHIPLPSTSSANAAMNLETLVEYYKVIKESLEQ